MKEIIIHVGMHKTGSTSIQETLKGYFSHGIKYANLGSSNHSVPITTIFSDNVYNYGNHVINGRGRKEIDDLREKSRLMLLNELNNPDVDKLIISGEEISYLSEKSVLNMRGFLEKYAKKIKIISYIRDPIEFSNSALQQVIKGGYKGDKIPQPIYRDRFEKYIRVFGRENVEFRLFDKNKFLNKSVVLDFCSWVDIPLNLISEKTMNESIPAEVVRLIYLFNREGVLSIGRPELMKSRNEMIGILSKHFFEKFKLPDHVIFDHVNFEDVEWMSSVSGFNFVKKNEVNFEKENCTSIKDFLCEDVQNLIKNLRVCLSAEGVIFYESDDVVMLLNKLYYHLLINAIKVSAMGEKSFRGDDVVDFVKKKAISLEGKNIKSAYILMRAAQILNPKDIFIKNKVFEYFKIIDVK